MRTDELVAALAGCAEPSDQREVSRRFAARLAGAVLLCLFVVAALVGPRPDWRVAIVAPMFWAKLAFAALVMLAAAACARRLGYPGMRLGRAPMLLPGPFVAVWVMAVLTLAAARPDQRPGLLMGSSALKCVFLVSIIALPALAVALRAMAGLAPTRLRAAGACAGLFSGAAAAFAYAFACTEMQAPFLAVWYVLGMAVPTAAGALAGPRLLRW